jgi:hypothetical protein
LEYLKDEINELATNIKDIRDVCRGLNEFERVCQSRSNLVKDKKGDVLMWDIVQMGRRGLLV